MRSLLLCQSLKANIDCGDAIIDIQHITAVGLEYEQWQLGMCDAEKLELIFQNSSCQQVIDPSKTQVYKW